MKMVDLSRVVCPELLRKQRETILALLHGNLVPKEAVEDLDGITNLLDWIQDIVDGVEVRDAASK